MSTALLREKDFKNTMLLLNSKRKRPSRVASNGRKPTWFLEPTANQHAGVIAKEPDQPTLSRASERAKARPPGSSSWGGLVAARPFPHRALGPATVEDVIVRAAVRNRCWILVDGGPNGADAWPRHRLRHPAVSRTTLRGGGRYGARPRRYGFSSVFQGYESSVSSQQPC